VVVDDWDMQISHVLRGDDHVNNTPRQINILRALGAELPVYGHVPMILGPDGDKLSKRHGAVSVMQYEEAGYLPEAMINYLSRLGWSHGDDELFDRAQLVQWFDGAHLAKSPAQWDAAKLNWVNAQYIKAMADDVLAPMVAAQMARLGVQVTDGRLVAICGLFKDRCDTTVALAQWACGFYAPAKADPAERERLVNDALRPAVALLADKLTDCEWTRVAIAAAIKEVLAATGLKMPQLAMAARVLVLGTSQTPSLDAVIELFLREEVVARLKTA
jgi:glutamyl-tRNA synthetase